MAVFCYVAHKDGYWAGICSPEIGRTELKKFLGDFAAEGFSITSCEDRAAYNKLLDTMPEWSESPEYKKKHPAPEPLLL